MANIFVSYNRKSEEMVKTLVDDLKTLGHIVWFDQELTGGQSWWDQILTNIESCDVFLSILCLETFNSTACKSECRYAADLGKPIIPLMVSDGVSTNILPPFLSKIHIIDYRQNDRKTAFRLVKALNTVPPSKPLPDPLPSPPEVPVSYLVSLNAKIETTSPMNFEEQKSLVFDLRRGLRDSETADDSRSLLVLLKKRADIFVPIGEEIDELLKNSTQKSSFPMPNITPPASQDAAIPPNAKSDFELGNLNYENKNYTEAETWYLKAADYGHAGAQNCLGEMYSKGHGVSPDDDEAVKWYRKAVAQGFAIAQYNLGVMYMDGRGVAQDDDEAVKLFREAAAQGNAIAQNNLGIMYQEGRGVARNDVEAVKWYRKAAAQGNENARENLDIISLCNRGLIGY